MISLSTMPLSMEQSQGECIECTLWCEELSDLSKYSLLTLAFS